uniref:non-specific serine/threonine protein kinase n=1 Tax=Rhizophora mucronata TaxID=61149 RepID=A0A2P2MUC0_RHIMU
MANISFEGDAYALERRIELTSNSPGNHSVGRATYSKAVHLWDKASGNLADFNTHFSFVINSEGNVTKGSGMAFFLAPNGSHIPTDSGGGKLALYSAYLKPEFVAVEFDTHQTEWDPKDLGDHVGIDLSSISSSITCNWTLNDIRNGGRIETWIVYNSTTKNLSVSVVNGEESSYTEIVYCYLWQKVDLKEYLPEWVTIGFTAASLPTLFELHEVYSWDFSSSLQLPENLTNDHNQTGPQTPQPAPIFSGSRKNNYLIWIILTVCGILLLLLGLAWFFCWSNRTHRRGSPASMDVELENETGPRSFSFEELAAATNNFDDAGMLGRGGFGRVYQGFLSDRNSNVAVKRITPDSQQGLKEYAAEVNTISQLRHRNLVKLIGWCREKEEFLIVYEFMPNKSLYFHLFNNPCLLTWETRYRIALGLASALSYLQGDCDQCVLHRDIKSSNVLLDSSFNAKLGDFGLARLVEHGHDLATTELLCGSDGYVAPEYIETRKASKETDVYSFGIVALELACGRPAIFKYENNGVKCRKSLVAWVWVQYGSGNILAVADPRLAQNYIEEEVMRLIVVGLLCAHPSPLRRPSIGEAIDILRGRAQLPVLPLEITMPPNIATHHGNASAFSGSSSHSASGSGQGEFSGNNSSTQRSTSTTARSATIE